MPTSGRRPHEKKQEKMELWQLCFMWFTMGVMGEYMYQKMGSLHTLPSADFFVTFVEQCETVPLQLVEQCNMQVLQFIDQCKTLALQLVEQCKVLVLQSVEHCKTFALQSVEQWKTYALHVPEQCTTFALQLPDQCKTFGLQFITRASKTFRTRAWLQEIPRKDKLRILVVEPTRHFEPVLTFMEYVLGQPNFRHSPRARTANLIFTVACECIVHILHWVQPIFESLKWRLLLKEDPLAKKAPRICRIRYSSEIPTPERDVLRDVPGPPPRKMQRIDCSAKSNFCNSEYWVRKMEEKKVFKCSARFKSIYYSLFLVYNGRRYSVPQSFLTRTDSFSYWRKPFWLCYPPFLSRILNNPNLFPNDPFV